MNDITKILKQLPITACASNDCIADASLIAMPEFIQIQRDQIILSPGQTGDALYVLCDGRAAAYSAD
ncbi:MAG: hypothetical protein J6R46_06965, partial [Clostridia bacterium]|nr:hypothetical protein [Clostridia bacterium]